MNKKYVYIFTNTHSTDIIKIGKTDKYPQTRAEQLNRQTGTIGTFEVAWFKEVLDNNIAESLLHYALRDLNTEKEYFDINLSIAIEICETIISEVLPVVENQKEIVIDKLQHKLELYERLLKEHKYDKLGIIFQKNAKKARQRIAKIAPSV